MYMRNYPAAKSDLEYVKELSPSSPGANINLGRLALAMNDVASASGYYEKALQLAPENFDALSGLINVFNSQKKFDASHDRIDKVMQVSATGPMLKLLPSLMFLKAQTYAGQGNNDAAEAEFIKAIDTDPNYLPAYAAYASLLMDKKQVDRALQQYQRVLQSRPNDASTYALIALLEEGRNNTNVAETNYRKALELNPGMPIAANNLAWIIAESNDGNPDEALLYAKAAVAKLPNNPALYDTLGWVYHKKGLPGPAVENLKKAVAMENAQATARGKAVNPAYNLRLGIALASLGDKQNARREVETALRNERMLSVTEAQNAKNLLGTL
jgi:tetratricopeptide (TPR) repeat protein